MVNSKSNLVTILKNFRNDAIWVKISGLHIQNLYSKKKKKKIQATVAYLKEKPNPPAYLWKRFYLSFQVKNIGLYCTIECGFTLKHVHDMIRTYSQIDRTGKYSQHSSIIWPVWLNG